MKKIVLMAGFAIVALKRINNIVVIYSNRFMHGKLPGLREDIIE